MKTHRIGISLIPLMLAGCAYGKMVMKIDPSLESNALVYEVKNPKSSKNLSFGSYRVEGYHETWARSSIIPERDRDWLDIIFSVDMPVEKIEETVWSYSYKFIVGDEIIWDAECEYRHRQHKRKEKWVSSVTELRRQHAQDDWTDKPGNESEVLSAWFLHTCRYTCADNKPWIFSIDKSGIKMTNNEVLFQAQAGKAVYIAPDGREYRTIGNQKKGYYWVQGDKRVAALSWGAELPTFWKEEHEPDAVWLDKRNSDAINDALAMASAGLLLAKQRR